MRTRQERDAKDGVVFIELCEAPSSLLVQRPIRVIHEKMKKIPTDRAALSARKLAAPKETQVLAFFLNIWSIRCFSLTTLSSSPKFRVKSSQPPFAEPLQCVVVVDDLKSWFQINGNK
ncbi:hypothetical protein K1719_043595 [Acacia pycnantha]|nr:hypothetical protein K1719_043595 [Acacia pycnantha]